MADVINLRMAKKRRERTAREAEAAANRAAHGRTLAEKRATAAEAERRDAALDGAKREE
jgi:hypothetical protein